MEIKKIYNRRNTPKYTWNYYNKKNLKRPIIPNTDSCYDFISKYIEVSEKSNTKLSEGIESLKKKDPKRLTHIVSSFFIGVWMFKQSNYINQAITNELEKLECFKIQKDINEQYAYVWFMISLFHDLGYDDEYKGDCSNNILDSEKETLKNILNAQSVPPDLYNKETYINYYKYRKSSELSKLLNCHGDHGIYAGIKFDKDICVIRRRRKEQESSNLDWRDDLEELYHYVARIILSHNIWLITENDKNKNEYLKYHLENLILSSKTKEYKIKFKNYPLFVFFCIIDTIEPSKSTTCYSDVDISLNNDNDTIIITSNDNQYLEKVMELNEWLTPTIKDGNKVTIYLSN